MSQTTSIILHVPLNIRRRGGRKVVIAPDGSVLPQAQSPIVPPTADPVLVKALARAFRCRPRCRSALPTSPAWIAA